MVDHPRPAVSPAQTTGTHTPGSVIPLWASGYADARPDPKAEGLYLSHLDLTTGTLSSPQVHTKLPSASFIANHPRLPLIYALHEAEEGAVSVINLTASGPGEVIGKSATNGAHPCHIIVQDDALIISHYGSGGVSLIPLGPDGIPCAPAYTTAPLAGSGPYPQQQQPRAHYALPAPHANTWWIADLGSDEIRVLTRQNASSKLAAELTLSTAIPMPPGSGPRHLCALPDGSVVAVGELDSRIYLLTPSADYSSGTIHSSQPTHRMAEYDGPQYPSHVAASADGRRVYTATRGPNVLSVFDYTPAAQGGAGSLIHRADVQLSGNWPRHFAVLPDAPGTDGDVIVVAEQESNSLTMVRVPAEVPQSGIGQEVTTAPQVDMPGASCVLPGMFA